MRLPTNMFSGALALSPYPPFVPAKPSVAAEQTDMNDATNVAATMKRVNDALADKYLPHRHDHPLPGRGLENGEDPYYGAAASAATSNRRHPGGEDGLSLVQDATSPLAHDADVQGRPAPQATTCDGKGELALEFLLNTDYKAPRQNGLFVFKENGLTLEKTVTAPVRQLKGDEDYDIGECLDESECYLFVYVDIDRDGFLEPDKFEPGSLSVEDGDNGVSVRWNDEEILYADAEKTGTSEKDAGPVEGDPDAPFRSVMEDHVLVWFGDGCTNKPKIRTLQTVDLPDSALPSPHASHGRSLEEEGEEQQGERRGEGDEIVWLSPQGKGNKRNEPKGSKSEGLDGNRNDNASKSSKGSKSKSDGNRDDGGSKSSKAKGSKDGGDGGSTSGDREEGACSSNEFEFGLSLRTDSQAADSNGIILLKEFGNQTVPDFMKPVGSLEDDTEYELTTCLAYSECYLFMYVDRDGNGFSADAKDAFIELQVNGFPFLYSNASGTADVFQIEKYFDSLEASDPTYLMYTYPAFDDMLFYAFGDACKLDLSCNGIKELDEECDDGDCDDEFEDRESDDDSDDGDREDSPSSKGGKSKASKGSGDREDGSKGSKGSGKGSKGSRLLSDSKSKASKSTGDREDGSKASKSKSKSGGDRNDSKGGKGTKSKGSGDGSDRNDDCDNRLDSSDDDRDDGSGKGSKGSGKGSKGSKSEDDRDDNGSKGSKGSKASKADNDRNDDGSKGSKASKDGSRLLADGETGTKASKAKSDEADRNDDGTKSSKSKSEGNREDSDGKGSKSKSKSDGDREDSQSKSKGSKSKGSNDDESDDRNDDSCSDDDKRRVRECGDTECKCNIELDLAMVVDSSVSKGIPMLRLFSSMISLIGT